MQVCEVPRDGKLPNASSHSNPRRERVRSERWSPTAVGRYGYVRARSIGPARIQFCCPYSKFARETPDRNCGSSSAAVSHNNRTATTALNR